MKINLEPPDYIAGLNELSSRKNRKQTGTKLLVLSVVQLHVSVSSVSPW